MKTCLFTLSANLADFFTEIAHQALCENQNKNKRKNKRKLFLKKSERFDVLNRNLELLDFTRHIAHC